MARLSKCCEAAVVRALAYECAGKSMQVLDVTIDNLDVSRTANFTPRVSGRSYASICPEGTHLHGWVRR